MATTTITSTQTVAQPVGTLRITAENVQQLFPEINTSLRESAARSSELEGYDEEQVRLMDEVCIVLDEDDNPIGSASKKTCMSFSSAGTLCYRAVDAYRWHMIHVLSRSIR